MLVNEVYCTREFEKWMFDLIAILPTFTFFPKNRQSMTEKSIFEYGEVRYVGEFVLMTEKHRKQIKQKAPKNKNRRRICGTIAAFSPSHTSSVTATNFNEIS